MEGEQVSSQVEIELRGVRKSFRGSDRPAIRDLDLAVRSGEFLILLGESGCGKTTTLKLINRLLEPTAGTITISGENILNENPVSLRRRIGYVVQGIGLFPHMSVAENVGIVPSLIGWDKDRIAARVEELLETVGLSPGEFSDRMPAELSGGQQQRVGVARALAVRPGIMLMDEPFGALDPLTRDKLQEEFRDLQRKLDLTVVMVTHDMMEAVLLADRIAIMREGGIIEIGEPAELLRNAREEYTSALLSAPKEQVQRLSRLLGEEQDDD